MLIHPDFRGGALEEDQLAWAEQQARLYCGLAARLAALAPVSGNGLAIALYESCGWRVVLTDQDYALDLVERG